MALCVSIPVPTLAHNLLPERLRNGGTFTVTPVLFNIGINEEATLAER